MTRIQTGLNSLEATRRAPARQTRVITLTKEYGGGGVGQEIVSEPIGDIVVLRSIRVDVTWLMHTGTGRLLFALTTGAGEQAGPPAVLAWRNLLPTKGAADELTHCIGEHQHRLNWSMNMPLNLPKQRFALSAVTDGVINLWVMVAFEIEEGR